MKMKIQVDFPKKLKNTIGLNVFGIIICPTPPLIHRKHNVYTTAAVSAPRVLGKNCAVAKKKQITQGGPEVKHP